ncbi:hypothetical protein CRENBAI_011911 [Crenichthys baileyi]|uniref:small monomeric GTPase n=1 Tax=Crenichthys baileyi TaxID=28760 RepID=A0AAV9SEB0_9TELE
MLSLNSISGSSVIDMEDTQTLPSKAFPYNEELTHKPSEPVRSQLFQVELYRFCLYLLTLFRVISRLPLQLRLCVPFRNKNPALPRRVYGTDVLRRFHDLTADLEAGPAFIALPSFSPEDTEPTSSCHKASDSAGLHTEHQMKSYNSPLCTILVGDSGVGKTSLLVQFDQGKFIPGLFSSTVGIGFTPSDKDMSLRWAVCQQGAPTQPHILLMPRSGSASAPLIKKVFVIVLIPEMEQGVRSSSPPPASSPVGVRPCDPFHLWQMSQSDPPQLHDAPLCSAKAEKCFRLLVITALLTAGGRRAAASAHCRSSFSIVRLRVFNTVQRVWRSAQPGTDRSLTPCASSLPWTHLGGLKAAAAPALLGSAMSMRKASLTDKQAKNGTSKYVLERCASINEYYDIAFKVMLLGDSAVGKTCVLVRFKDGAFLGGNFIATVGIDFRNKVVDVDNLKVKLQIWDTAGQERFRSVTHAYYRDAQALLLLYDITNKPSFDNIRAWLTEIHEYAQKDVVIMLLGNKSDTAAERVVKTEDGEKLAKEYGVPFMETSAKTGVNVELAFLAIAKELKHRATQQPNEPKFQIHDYIDSQKHKSGCCSLG